MKARQILRPLSRAPGSLSIQDYFGLVPYTSNACTFSTVGGSLRVEAGRIWASVQCEDPRAPTEAESACMIEGGVFLFENCAR
jgi:hypothetical protein